MVRIASSSIKQKRRKRLLIVAGIIFAILVLLFLLCLWVANTSLLRITHVSVSGENVIPQTSIEEVVRDDIVGSYAGLFSKANIFLYPKKNIEEDLHRLYPTLGSVDVRALDFHTVAITVAERTPSALWCPSADSTQCVLLDESGLAYAHAPEYSGNVYRVYLGALSDGPLPKQFLTPATFHSLSALVETFAKKIAPATITTVTVDEHNDVRLSSSGGYEIVFALGESGGDIFQRFTLTLTAAPFTTHALSEFDYIDLRFGDKVYYKLKN
ncbi:hypothetical protein K2Q00_01410 [Patescibacteria group bacterium]|nr:hypothetical protein [Patescibacteria group bacterium]